MFARLVWNLKIPAPILLLTTDFVQKFPIHGMLTNMTTWPTVKLTMSRLVRKYGNRLKEKSLTLELLPEPEALLSEQGNI